MCSQLTRKRLDKRSKILKRPSPPPPGGRSAAPGGDAERAARFHVMFETFKASKRLSESEEAIARVERRVTALEIQWTDTLDRLKTMMGRILKERARTEAARDSSPNLSLSDEDVPAGSSSLSQSQEAINQRILARRNRMRSTQ